MMKIDFVVPWVDGSDPEWQRQKSFYTNTPIIEGDVRYRDWGSFKYWFRAVEKYAPWVNRIFLITCGQVPEWLNVDHPKLRLIEHKDYMPQEYLPTFSANPIELNIHRIPELSEHFVYLNDDMFLNCEAKEEDFFVNGSPCLSAVLSEFIPTIINDEFLHCLCNDIAFLNSHFKKRDVIKANREKWYTPVYGKGMLKNVFYSLNRHGFSMLQNFHMASPMLKSTYEKVWMLEPELLHETSLHKTRNIRDVNQYIMSYYDIGTGNFNPRNPRDGHYYEIGRYGDVLRDDIINGRHKIICINDTVCENFEEETQSIIAAFEKKFAEKSFFEI